MTHLSFNSIFLKKEKKKIVRSEEEIQQATVFFPLLFFCARIVREKRETVAVRNERDGQFAARPEKLAVFVRRAVWAF